MKVITCAGYMGSGSSAVSDLVAEYEEVKSLSDFEFRFLHDIDGVSDLEYHLCQCHNRHNSGHALKRFIRLSKFNEGNFFAKKYTALLGKAYKDLTQAYIDELTDFKYTGWWFYDLYDKGTVYYYFIQIINHFLLEKIPGFHKTIPFHEQTYCSHPTEEKFLESTQKYVAGILAAANPERKAYLQIDQIVPSQNINRILRYFSDDIFVFLVDRDPRDLYLLCKYHWHMPICSTGDPEDFCKWFLYTRHSGSPEKLNPQRVMRLRFEDLIYRYQEIVEKIENFTGLMPSNHVRQFEKMNPKRSVYNTQLWNKYTDDPAISVIEKRLGEYLYPYEEVENHVIWGIEPQSQQPF